MRDDTGATARWHPLTCASISVSIGVLAVAPWIGDLRFVLPLAAILGSGLLTAVHDRADLSKWLRALVTAWVPLAISLFLIHGLFSPGGTTILASLGPLELTLEGIEIAWRFAGRLLVVASALAFLLAAVSASTATSALAAHGRFPDIVLVARIALNSLPAARRRAAAIRDAQRARGMEASGGLFARLRSAPSLIVPLALGLLLDAETRALALEMRGSRLRGSRSQLYVLDDSRRQQVVRRLMPLISAALVIVFHASSR